LNSIKKNNVFSNSLGIPGLIVVAFFLVFGLKTKFDYNFFNAPPNVFEFNMYVFEMTSLIDGGYYPDIYVKKDGDFILVERDLIKESLCKVSFFIGVIFCLDHKSHQPNRHHNSSSIIFNELFS
jgi:hypothetical protein